jgi:hypothetical protein
LFYPRYRPEALRKVKSTSDCFTSSLILYQLFHLLIIISRIPTMFWLHLYMSVKKCFGTSSFLFVLYYLQGTRITCVFINMSSNLCTCLYYSWELKDCVARSQCNEYVTGLTQSGNATPVLPCKVNTRRPCLTVTATPWLLTMGIRDNLLCGTTSEPDWRH